MDKARIRDLEGLYSAAQCRVDELDGALDAAYMANEALEAQAAAMREALEETDFWLKQDSVYQTHRARVAAALAPDAGRALLERLAKAEAERVEAVNLDDYCNTFACAMSCNKDKCSLWQMYCWLRDHGMIREAE